MYNVITNVLHELFSYSISLTQDKTHLNSMKGDDIGKTLEVFSLHYSRFTIKGIRVQIALKMAAEARLRLYQ